ncbi:MAG: transposase [Leptospirales bacterium]|nr:transposase [Leptospirales bacterium]
MYPKFCPHCKTQLNRDISTRETAIRCDACNFQGSRTSYTPLHHIKLPLWVFSYLLVEQIHRFPQVLNASEIQRKLGCAKNTATKLKRRLQIFHSELIPGIKEVLRHKLMSEGNSLLPETGDLTEKISNRSVVHMDGLALFSASQRANGGRARWKHTGQTASVYLTDSVAEEKGKFQIGSLVHTIAVKKGPVFLSSLPSFKQKHVQPLLDFLPEHTPLFSDDGFPWLSRYNANHRSINHSARAKDRKRNVWARNRYSRDGVNNNTAEGVQRIVKHAFISGYSYISPEFSQMYLSEFSGLKGIRVYGLQNICESLASLGYVRKNDSPSVSGDATRPDHRYLRNKIAKIRYNPPSFRERNSLDHASTRRLIKGKLKGLLDQNDFFEARQGHLDYFSFWEDAPLYRKALEKKYNAIAHAFWSKLDRWDQKHIRRIATEIKAPHRLLLRIARKWNRLGLAKLDERWNPTERRIYGYANRLVSDLPDLLYSYEMRDWMNLKPREARRILRPLASKYGLNRNRRAEHIQELHQ